MSSGDNAWGEGMQPKGVGDITGHAWGIGDEKGGGGL